MKVEALKGSIYKVENLVGQGAYAFVYKAKNTVSGEFVAVKSIRATCKSERVMLELELLHLLG